MTVTKFKPIRGLRLRDGAVQNPRDAEPPAKSDPQVCLDCNWQGNQITAFDHHMRTGHAIRGKNWPECWGNAHFPGADVTGRRKVEGHE